MQRIAHIVSASTMLAFSAAPALAQTGLFGIGEFGTGLPQSLYAINETTGAASVIGSTGLVDAIDLAFDASGNRLVALTAGGDRYAINARTGQATLIADIVDFIPEGALAINAAGSLYTTSFDDLFVASETGSFSLVGASGLTNAYDVSGLAFVNNRLFGFATNGSDSDALVSYNPATGAAAVVGINAITASESLGGLAWSFAGTDVFATNGSGLFRISTIDGSALSIGSHGIQGVSGIAYIPSPSAGLALFGGACLISRRRRA